MAPNPVPISREATDESGTGFPMDVTVYVGTDEPNTVSFSQTVATNGTGGFSADFSGIYVLIVWHHAIVAYSEGGVEVHEHVYPGDSLLVRPAPWNAVMGTSLTGSVVTATVYDSGWSMKVSTTLETDPTNGWYDLRSLRPGDLVTYEFLTDTDKDNNLNVGWFYKHNWNKRINYGGSTYLKLYF